MSENTNTGTTTKQPPSAVDDCAEVVNQSWTGRVTKAAVQAPESKDLQLIRVDYGSERYKQTLALRQAVLRAPLGLSVWDENLTLESTQEHYALMDCSDRVLACLVVVPIGAIQGGANQGGASAEHVKIRQMAVADHLQGQGLGRSLMMQVETLLKARGVTHSELHARESALGFYQSLGYTAIGPTFMEVTVPHRKMVKVLS